MPGPAQTCPLEMVEKSVRNLEVRALQRAKEARSTNQHVSNHSSNHFILCYQQDSLSFLIPRIALDHMKAQLREA